MEARTTTALAIGTMKGAWIAWSDDSVDWQLDGPYLKGWQVTTFGRAADGSHLLATGSSWFGAAIHRSTDLEQWDQVVAGPAFDEADGRKLEQVWTFADSGERLLAGVAEAALFTSDDSGETWSVVAGLDAHPTRKQWEPGLGGLAAHRVLVDTGNPQRMWTGISAVGVFATEDGGETWELRNEGVEVTSPSDGGDIGYCVHALVAHPDDADTIWRQDHRGVYRTDDGGVSWERIERGLPGAGFGFPIDRDAASGALFVVPLESDQYRMPVDGQFAVYRSTDDGDSWHRCEATADSYTSVLRDAMATDCRGGVYIGTTGGEVIHSPDGGDGWIGLPWRFPRILSTHVLSVA